MWDFPLFPERASALARHVDAVFFFELAVSVVMTIVICVLILYCAIKYRRGSRASRANAKTQDVKLEVIWVTVPLMVMMVMFVWGMVVYFEQFRAPDGAPDVYVLGRQWMWEVRHPEGKREINELHVPLGRPVKLTMSSQDVIHSFFIPAFRVKQDVLPGRYTELWFQPERTGKFHLFCAEYCGTKHSGMVGWVIVMEPAEYERWLQTGTTEVTMAEAGAPPFRA